MQKLVSIIMTKEKAETLRPVLAWLRTDEKTEEGVQRLAADLLRKLRGVNDWESIVVTLKEYKLIHFILDEFPPAIQPKQELLPGFENIKVLDKKDTLFNSGLKDMDDYYHRYDRKKEE